jgi:cytochrome P450
MLVPAGAELVIPQFAVHRSARYFDEPDAFRPERWTPELMKNLPKFAYFPFGGGQRICIGNHFGLHEGVRIVSEITRRFKLRLAEGSEAAPVLGITLLPREGSLWMGFRRRNNAGLARPRVHGNGRPSCCK